MNCYRCQANSITFHFLTVTHGENFLQCYISMFPFPTISHRGRWLWYFCLLSDYTIRKSLHLPHTAQTSKISLLFTKAHRWLLDFLMLLFKSIDSYPIRKDGNQRARSCKLFTCKIHANYIICILTFLAYNVIIIMLNK